MELNNMPLYTKSNGEQIDTGTMADPYIERALAKAERDGNAENVAALEAEIAAREEAQ